MAKRNKKNKNTYKMEVRSLDGIVSYGTYSTEDDAKAAMTNEMAHWAGRCLIVSGFIMGPGGKFKETHAKPTSV